MALATKTESQKIFGKLRSKAANKVCFDCSSNDSTWSSIPFGIYLCLDCSSKHRNLGTHISFVRSTNLDLWQWDQLRIMKVGGNESATRYFQSHGGSAALANKDPKTKYTSNAAEKYRTELTRRAAADADQHPGTVVITDVPDLANGGTSTPAGEPAEGDFFSSWDKATVKRPSNPPSRTATPSQASRAASPFLNPGAAANGGSAGARPKSPLVGAGSASQATAEPDQGASAAEGKSGPTASRTTSSSAIRKSGTAGGPRQANILGAKKTKLGAKKVAGGDALDFEAAEQKAKEEAETRERLGYDPDDAAAVAANEVAQAKAKAQAKADTPPEQSENGSVAASNQPKGETSADGSKSHERSSGELERLGMGVGRLGFGQIGGARSAAQPKKLGFGAVGTPRSTEDDSEKYARQKFGSQKGISSDEFFGRAAFNPTAQTEAKSRLQTFEGATSISSNAYFGRPEEDTPTEDYGDLEGAARDFVRKFGLTAGDDLENLTHLLGEGANKLQGAIRNYLGR